MKIFFKSHFIPFFVFVANICILVKEIIVSYIVQGELSVSHSCTPVKINLRSDFTFFMVNICILIVGKIIISCVIRVGYR